MFEEDALAGWKTSATPSSCSSTPRTSISNVLYRRKDGDFGIIEPIIAGDYTPGRGVRSRSGQENGRN